MESAAVGTSAISQRGQLFICEMEMTAGLLSNGHSVPCTKPNPLHIFTISSSSFLLHHRDAGYQGEEPSVNYALIMLLSHRAASSRDIFLSHSSYVYSRQKLCALKGVLSIKEQMGGIVIA